MIERFHAHLLELLELIERWLGIDHVPVVGETGIVDLQHDAGLNDRFVLFVHSVSRGEQEFFLGLVVEIHTAGEATGADRDMKASSTSAAAIAFFRLAISAWSAAWPVYFIGPVQAGRPTGRRAALPIRLPL